MAGMYGKNLNTKAYNPYFSYVCRLYDYKMQLQKITVYKCFFQPSWQRHHQDNYWQPTKVLKKLLRPCSLHHNHDLYLCRRVVTLSHMHSCLLNPSPSDSKRKYSAHTSVPSRPWYLGLFLLGFAGRKQGWHSWSVHSLWCTRCWVWLALNALKTELWWREGGKVSAPLTSS